MGPIQYETDGDVKMSNTSCWSEVIAQVCDLEDSESKGLNKVKFDLLERLRDAENDPLSFPAACTLIGVSSFIWGVVDLSYYGKYLGKSYTPKKLRPLFQHDFFQSLAKDYSNKISCANRLAFKSNDMKTNHTFIERVKANWQDSPLPEAILKTAGAENITLSTEKFYDRKWLKTQKDKKGLQRVLLHIHGGQKKKEIENLDLEQLKGYFRENLCKGSSYFDRLNVWVNGLIAKTNDSPEQIPTPPSLSDANISQGSASSDVEKDQESDDTQTSEAEVSTAAENGTQFVSVAPQTSKAANWLKPSASSETRWKMRQKHGDVYAICNKDDAQENAQSDMKELNDMTEFSENQLIAAIRSAKYDVEIQGVQPYGKGHRVALVVYRGKLRKNVLCASKALPHLYPLNKQPHIRKVLKDLKAESKALTVKKAERNTTFDQYE